MPEGDHRARVGDEAGLVVREERGGEPQIREFRAALEVRRFRGLDLGREDREPAVLAEEDQLVDVDARERAAVEPEQTCGPAKTLGRIPSRSWQAKNAF
jgi:hypothetical protein